MKIKTIEVQNFKAIEEAVADFNGCSAIITAGNEKGKTSLLRGLIDRFRGEKAEIILKDGKEKGFNIIQLTDGSRIEWKFTAKTESFAYITPDGIKQTTGVLKTIGERYFGIKFNIDKFLNSTPKEQTKTLSKLVGIDLSQIDAEYKEAYDNRTEANRALKDIRSRNLKKPEKVKKPDIESIKEELEEVQNKNRETLSDHQERNSKLMSEVLEFNKEQERLQNVIDESEQSLLHLKKFEGTVFEECINISRAEHIFENLARPNPKKEFKHLPTPKTIDESEIRARLENAYEALREHDKYKRDLSDYNAWVKQERQAKKRFKECDNKVKEVEKKKIDLISNAKIPKEFEINDDGVYYNGLPLSDNQISSSAKYIAALKLGSMVLGELKTMHFDASFLDRNSLEKIKKWASENDLQLLIERPDFSGGDIKYNII